VQIRTRLTLRFTALVGAIVLISFLVIYYLGQQFIQQDFYERLHDKAVTSAILLIKTEEIDSALLKVIDRAKRDILDQQFVIIYDPEGSLLYNSADSILFEMSPSFLTRVKVNSQVEFMDNGYEMVGFEFRDKHQEYIVVGGAVDDKGRRLLTNLRNLLISLFVVLVMIVCYSGWIFSGRALQPIKKVITDVQSLSPNQLNLRLTELDQQDEIGKLIAIINEQLARIETAFQSQKMFIANVSHELNNPLTKVTSQLEVTLLKPRSAEEYKVTIESVLEDIRELNQLSSSLLELARVSQNESAFVRQRIRLDEILWEIREGILTLDNQYRVDIDIDMPEDESKLCVMGNAYLMKVAIRNVIENACKFSEDHQAKISLYRQSEDLIIVVTDDGIGMKETDIQHIFQPFYRTNVSSKIKGHGIGLSLSHRIVAIHQGAIRVDSAEESGTRVIITLPGI
jgi:signal transduction histidine kinase